MLRRVILGTPLDVRFWQIMLQTGADFALAFMCSVEGRPGGRPWWIWWPPVYACASNPLHM
jgi:hypothetical protein